MRTGHDQDLGGSGFGADRYFRIKNNGSRSGPRNVKG